MTNTINPTLDTHSMCLVIDSAEVFDRSTKDALGTFFPTWYDCFRKARQQLNYRLSQEVDAQRREGKYLDLTLPEI